MPRTVNVSDRTDRRENNKQTGASGETGFFGIRRLWASSGSDMSPEIATHEVESPSGSTAESFFIEDVVAPLPPEVLPHEATSPDVTVTPEPPPFADRIVAKSVPVEIVGAEGGVDFDLLFQSARLPAVTVNADHAIHVLESIPADLPVHVKQLLVKTSLSVMTNLVQEGSVSADIVGDAAQKMLWIARLQENVTAEINTERENTYTEIALLEARIAAKNSQLLQAETRATAALKSCRNRADQLHNVTLFFDQQGGGRDNNGGDHGSGNATDDANTEKEQIPPYLREDSVLRLLGLPEVPESDHGIAGRNVLIASERRNGALRHA